METNSKAIKECMKNSLKAQIKAYEDGYGSLVPLIEIQYIRQMVSILRLPKRVNMRKK